MTLFAPNGAGLSGTIGAFVGDMCIGSSESNGGPIQIAVMGDDTDSPELDGAISGDIVTLILQNSDGVYVTETSFAYALNGIEIVEDLSFDYSCTGTQDIVGCMDGHYLEYDPAATVNDYDLCLTWKVFGCTDSSAANFNENANVDDESCTYLVLGCTDASACNYDSNAELNNGSCEYPCRRFDCEGNCLSGELLTMNDSYGDGWNGAVLTINGVDYTVAEGSSATACVDLLACNVVSWTAGAWDSETSWSVGDLSGSAGSGTGVSGDGCVTGCSDVTAENYNADADIADDSLCEYAQTPGCMDETACNYNSEAVVDDGSCTYAAEGLDCDGACLVGELLTMNDSYGDGWNGDVLTINGVDYHVRFFRISLC